MIKIKQFFNWLKSAWVEYSQYKHGRYNNGFYIKSEKKNCPYCKTDWKLNKNGVEYRCVYEVQA